MSYRNEIGAAWRRVNAVPSKNFASSLGNVEYATAGAGQPVLMSHGVMGGHPTGLGMVETYYGPAFAIAPSRFGYFRSVLPHGATPATQADVYAELLDELQIGRAVVIGFSAGGPSTIELALRYPERVELLVLASSALPRAFDPMPSMARKVGPIFMKPALSSNRPFWLFKTLMPKAFRRLLGVPRDFIATSAQRQTLDEVASSVFPIPPKREGAVFDTFTGNPHVDGCRLEEITVPTLIIHAADDSLAPYRSACDAAARMPFARFVTIPTGGHEFLGTEHVVREAIATYLQELHPARTIDQGERAVTGEDSSCGIDLYWLPLGAGGHFVHFNGRVYEWTQARREHRPPLNLYHTALIVMLPEGRFVIENAWPIPDDNLSGRGVTLEGPVWHRHLGRLRVFRYEVRRWANGTIADVGEAVASPQRVSSDAAAARRILDLAEQVPRNVWGRDELHVGEMWNSNSVISWLLTQAGVRAGDIEPPAGGRAPGWTAGVAAAEGLNRRERRLDELAPTHSASVSY